MFKKETSLRKLSKRIRWFLFLFSTKTHCWNVQLLGVSKLITHF